MHHAVTPIKHSVGDRRQLWLSLTVILLISIPLFFFNLGSWSFLDPDEGRYGAIPRQMLIHHDFITPTQNNAKFFDKPPLLYWSIAASYWTFGYNEWAARLIPALAALMSLFAVYGLGHRMFNSRAGLMGAVILATSAVWPILARVVVTDMLVSSLICVALTFWWLGHTTSLPQSATDRPTRTFMAGESQEHRVARHQQLGYFLAFWVALALGVLAKGPMAVVLTGGTLFTYMLVCNQWKSVLSMRWALGLPLFFAIAVPWYVLVAQRNPEFNHYFWYDQHIGRFLGQTTGNDHRQPAPYYLYVLPLLFFPWSLFLPAAVATAVKHLRDAGSERRKAVVFLLCGVGFITLFFSASSGKLVTYILPILPLLALLLAAYFEWMLEHRTLWNRMLTGSVAVMVLLLIVLGMAVLGPGHRKLHDLGIESDVVVLAGSLWLVWAAAVTLMSRQYRLNGLVASTAGGFALAFMVTMPVVASVANQFTTRALIAYVRPGLTPAAEVLSINYIQSLEFYTKRRVEMIGSPDEMQLGIQYMPPLERRKWVFDGPRKLEHVWEDMTDRHPVYCFVRIHGRREADIKRLMRDMGVNATPIIANERYLVFGNRAAVAATPPVFRAS